MQGTPVPFRMDMSGKNFRVVQAGQRTNAEGKQVSNKVLLATPDNEYELMRPDLTYIDLPHHLSLHEPTRSEEHTSELQSHLNLVCRLLLEKKKNYCERITTIHIILDNQCLHDVW